MPDSPTASVCVKAAHLHVEEGVVIQIAVVVHVRLHTPVVVEFLQQRMLVEEPAVVAAHVVVRLALSIQHAFALHGMPRSSRIIRADPLWVAPLLLGDLAIQSARLCRAGGAAQTGKPFCQKVRFQLHRYVFLGIYITETVNDAKDRSFSQSAGELPPFSCEQTSMHVR